MGLRLQWAWRNPASRALRLADSHAMFHVEHFADLCLSRIIPLDLQIPMTPRNLPPISLQPRHPKSSMKRFVRRPSRPAKCNEQDEGNHQTWSQPWDIQRLRQQAWKFRQPRGQHKTPRRQCRGVQPSCYRTKEKNHKRPKGALVQLLLLAGIAAAWLRCPSS